jgi:hypothetical protein
MRNEILEKELSGVQRPRVDAAHAAWRRYIDGILYGMPFSERMHVRTGPLETAFKAGYKAGQGDG